MTDNNIYVPEVITTYSFPDTEEPATTSTDPTSSKTITKPEGIPYAQKFPVKQVAVELLSSALNTQSKKILGNFTFGTIGAISIGTYENGVSGEVKISPDGIVAKNVNGTTTFSLDGTTGDAVFAGTIQAGAVVAGQVTVTGAFVVNDGTYNVIWIGYLSGGF